MTIQIIVKCMLPCLVLLISNTINRDSFLCHLDIFQNLGDHWYKEFVADNIAMMVTDLSRAVDKVQITMNRMKFGQSRGRKTSSQLARKELSKECTIIEENEVKMLT